MTITENLTIRKPEMQQLENEIKLLVNQRLYDKGYITSEMYSKAKSLILKSASL